MLNSCISSVAQKVLMVLLHEIVSFLQLTLWGCAFSRGKANIDSATAQLWGGWHVWVINGVEQDLCIYALMLLLLFGWKRLSSLRLD